MEKIKGLVTKKSRKSLHRNLKSLDQRPDGRSFADLPNSTGKELLPVPVEHTATRQSRNSTPLRSGSQWGKRAQGQSPTSLAHQQGKPLISASAVPDRDSSLRFKRALPPHIEEDCDRHRDMLAKSASSTQTGGREISRDAPREVQGPGSKNEQQKASLEYGRRQIQVTDGIDLNIQSLSIADNGTDIGRASTEPLCMNEINSNTRTSTNLIANPKTVTTRKSLPSHPKENTNAHEHTLSDTDLQDQAQSQIQGSSLPEVDQHSQSRAVSPTTDAPNYTLSTSLHPDPLARLPPSFNPTHTTNTTVDSTIAAPVTHETQHTRRLEIVQESISRDIHIDHYYHYIQPVRVVEVNPPKHFRIDSKGQKMPIAAPEGWKMPSDLSIRRAPDFTSDEASGGRGAGTRAHEGAGGVGTGAGPSRAKLAWERRDYVVDEENPKGRMLSGEELERARERDHLVSPAGVGDGGEE